MEHNKFNDFLFKLLIRESIILFSIFDFQVKVNTAWWIK